MRFKTIFVLSFFCAFSLSAQKGTTLIGTETFYSIIHKKDLMVNNATLFAATGFAPYVGVGLGKQWTVGVAGRYDRVKLDRVNLDDYIGIGLFTKYIIKSNNEKLERLGFPIGFTALRNNYFIENKVLQKRKNEYQIQGLAGVNFRVLANFYIEVGYTPQWFVGHDVFQDVTLSFEYRFGGSNDDSALLALFDQSLPTRKKGFAQTLVVGNAIAVVPQTDNEDSIINHWEYSWSKNIATNISDNFFVGINHIDVWMNNRLETNPRDHAYLVGGFTQYHFTKEGSRFKGILELGYYLGNLCHCNENTITFEGNPYVSEELLSYWGWGIGVEYYFTNNISLDLSFNANLILDDIEDKYGYTMPNIGVNYTVGR